jgi:hypothetical protein
MFDMLAGGVGLFSDVLQNAVQAIASFPGLPVKRIFQ